MSRKDPVSEEELVVLQEGPSTEEPDSAPRPGEGMEPQQAEENGRPEILRLEQEKEEIYQRYLRLRADLENIRRRTREEQAESRQRVIEEVVMQFLPVFDNLERAVNAPGETESWRRGVEMVLRQFQGALDALGLKAIPAVGEAFNPSYHEAVMQEPADAAENTILEEMQRGYLLGDKVIRPSKVKVASPLN